MYPAPEYVSPFHWIIQADGRSVSSLEMRCPAPDRVAGITQDYPGSRDPPRVERRSPYAGRGMRPGQIFVILVNSTEIYPPLARPWPL